jgi:ZIP family zinc transporter
VALPADVLIVFAVGLVTGLATGLGVLPFFLADEIGDRPLVVLWGLAAGIMLSAATVGLIAEGVAEGDLPTVSFGVLLGAAFVLGADRLIAGAGFPPPTATPAAADRRTAILTVGVLTVHSLPEGFAVGVAFADLGHETAITVAGVAVPELAVFMAVAVSILNVPEGLALAIPLVAIGTSRWRVVGWAVFSGLPQPIGAVLAYYFVSVAEGLLPVALGFAAGALFYLVFVEFIPAGLNHGADLDRRGRRELVSGLAVGAIATTGLVTFLGIG